MLYCERIKRSIGGSSMGKKVYEVKDDEKLFAGKVTGDCWKMPNLSINKQVSGKYYFTDKRIAFLASGFIGTESVSWEIEMKDIEKVKTCLTPPFFPFGILITMKNGDKYKLSILKRKKYFDWISEQTSK